MEKVSPIKIVEKPEFIPVDEWVPTEEDRYFKYTKALLFYQYLNSLVSIMIHY